MKLYFLSWLLLLGFESQQVGALIVVHHAPSCLEPSSTCLYNDNGRSDEAWDANVDYEKEWPKNEAPPDPSSVWDALPNLPDTSNLGVDVALEPLSEEEAKELKVEATNIINAAIEDGINDIETLRTKMTKELEQSRKIMQLASELQAKQKSEELMKKIDNMTGSFLDSTKETRSSTKLAAAASRAMEGRGVGLEMGTWGTLGGRTVVASGSGSLLGSIDNAIREQTERTAKDKDPGVMKTAEPTAPQASAINRVIIIADTKQDKLAKVLVPALQRHLEATDIPDVELEVLAPTAAMPLGGNNAACVITFCTSLSQASSLSGILDKLLRKTLQANGALGQPPTQLVGISTVGTERTDKFPYSVVNMLGKLDQRRQLEEVLINTVQRRMSEPPLDYTLIKLGDLKDSTNQPFDLRPGDVVDEATTVDTAVQAIVQAVAYQPFARNSTLCVTGVLPATTDNLFWDTSFLCLEGPELWRVDDVGDANQYRQLLEYVLGWAEILADTGKGLTTPVQAYEGIPSRSSHLVDQQDGVQLLFLRTKTGKNYMSKEEERRLEDEMRQKTGTSGATESSRQKLKEGGVDVVVEVTKDNRLRVRARRCNYADDAAIKELSEKTILKRLEDAIDVWRNEHL